MKLINLSLIAIFILSFFVPTNAQSFLRAEGKAIVNESGENFIFRGMGLGGWMLQEGYMLKTAGFANAQHKIKSKISELIGEEATKEFYDTWLANHVTRQDIEALKSWGFNSVRLPMHYNLYTLPIEDEPVPGQNTWLTRGFEMTDDLIEWCRDNDMYIILDLHAAPGGQGYDEGISDYDPSKPSLWESEANQQKTVALWKQIAERYADEPVIAAYDLINETNWNMDGNIPLRDLFYEITDAVRSVDTKHMIFIEGNWFANDFTNLTPPWDDNLVYSPHKYWSINDKASIQWVLDIREQFNVPLMLGESGENSNVWFTDAISLLENENIGWAWWPMKKIDDIAGPLSVERTEGYQQLLDYWNNGGTTPNTATAKATLMELAENFKLENCRYQKDVIDAMFRQVQNDEPAPYTTFEVPGVIYATDFDLGGLNVAYFDVDNANYQVSTGSYTAWNNGWSYRNDAVDIERSENTINTNGYNVGWLSKGEWMQYDINVVEDGFYDIKVRVAADGSDGKFYFASGTAPISSVQSVPNTGGWQTWETITVNNVVISSNDEKLRFYTDNQGFNLASFELIKVGETSNVATSYLSARTLDDKNVQLNFDKPLDPSSATDLSNFKIFANGSEVAINNATLDGANARSIYFNVNQTFRSSDDLKIFYDGSAIEGFDGTVLNTFANRPIENTVAIIHEVPGKIEMEDFFYQSGVQLESSTDEGGGENIGYLDNGDYLDYYINVPQTGTYSVDFRTAALSEMGAVKLQLIRANGEIENLCSRSFPATGGWQTWTTTESPQFSLPTGENQLRVTITQPLFNMNWMDFKLEALSDTDIPLYDVSVFPNPSTGKFQVECDISSRQTTKLTIYNALGLCVKSEWVDLIPNTPLTLDISNLPNGAYYFNLPLENNQILSRKLLKMD